MDEEIIDIIKSLEKDASTRVEETKQSLALRFIDSGAAVSLFLGLNPKNKTRYLFIHVKEKLSSKTVTNLPMWNGLTIVQNKTSIPLAGYYDEWFLVLSHQEEYDHKIFEAVIENICNDLLSLSQYGDMLSKLQRNLERWRSFFSINGWEGLSQEAEIGLYGELWVLRELLQNDPNTIENWVGPEKEPNDFQKSAIALEVKTITSKKHYKVFINNEKQLDDIGLKGLFLLAVVMRKIDSGETLFEIIESVRRELVNDPYSLNLFEEKLFLVGYLDIHSDLYDTGFVFQELLSYQVFDGFPRLLSKELHNGVGDLRYSINLGACEPYKVEFKEIINIYAQNEEK
ncbi:PD-(D/E)XK motif protein [Virgibacillus necropolis]|uniref:PD-(D/E)XK motif protein n=1 Tax=Virgibacillus necropolis TaxID=163877 RepID=UPI00384E7F38